MFTAPVSGLLWKRSNRASAKLVGEPTDDLGRLAEVVDLLAAPQAASWARPSPPRSLMDRPAVTSPPGQSLVDRPTGTSLLTELLTVSMRRLVRRRRRDRGGRRLRRAAQPELHSGGARSARGVHRMARLGRLRTPAPGDCRSPARHRGGVRGPRRAGTRGPERQPRNGSPVRRHLAGIPADRRDRRGGRRGAAVRPAGRIRSGGQLHRQSAGCGWTRCGRTGF
jgi:hypothetical protein